MTRPREGPVPTSGSFQPPARSRVQEMSIPGQWRRMIGSSATYTIHATEPSSAAPARPYPRMSNSSIVDTWCAPRAHIASCMTTTAAARRAAPRRSPRPARRFRRAIHTPPKSSGQQDQAPHEVSRARPGVALVGDVSDGSGPRADPEKGDGPAAIRGRLDAHRHAGALRVRALPRRARVGVIARAPSRLDRPEGLGVEPSGAEERRPVRRRNRPRRRFLDFRRHDVQLLQPAFGVETNLPHPGAKWRRIEFGDDRLWKGTPDKDDGNERQRAVAIHVAQAVSRDVATALAGAIMFGSTQLRNP